MAFYIRNFHLSRQQVGYVCFIGLILPECYDLMPNLFSFLICIQDAAEAFLHLLSCLRQEFSECYVPNYSSLAYISAFPNRRILTPSNREDTSEQKRWQRHFLGPFDGILGSLLTCQSCSFQVRINDWHLQKYLNHIPHYFYFPVGQAQLSFILLLLIPMVGFADHVGF